jgi:hypothetical protein
MELVKKAKAFLSGRRHAYQVTFDGPEGRKVLLDLARFCRAHESTFHENERLSNQLDGRREVWLRIQQHMNMTDEDLWELYGKTE